MELYYNQTESKKVYIENNDFPGIHTPDDLYNALSSIWCANTCAPRMRDGWTKENMTMGQCSITAFLAQDIFGGEVYAVLTENGNLHCFNVVNGVEFDLTSAQFGEKAKDLDYNKCTLQHREDAGHFGKEEKRLRYKYLKETLLKTLGDEKCIAGDKNFRYHTVLFDMDGTLLNTIDDMRDALNLIMEKYGYPGYEVSQVKYMVGNGIPVLIERATPDGRNNPQYENILKDYVEYYKAHCKIKTAAYAGIKELTATLAEKGIKMAVVTNKKQAAAEDLTKEHFPAIKVVVGDGDGREIKPHPDNVNEALRLLNLSEEDKKGILYVGDSQVDAMTGINAGLDYVLCLWGFRTKEDLKEYSPVAYIERPEELLDIVSGR